MKDTLIIVGTNKLTRQFIPWDRDDADYLVMNEVASLATETPEYWIKFLGPESKNEDNSYWARRVNICLQMHVPAIFRNQHNLNHKKHYQWLQENRDIQIIMQDHYDDVPRSERYPLEEICNEFLSTLRNEKDEIQKVFTSTAAYAIALGMYQHRNRIELYGVECASGTEYVRQKAGILFWIGAAAGRGVKVVINSHSLLLADKLYGYVGEVMIGRQEFEMSKNALEQSSKGLEVATFEAAGVAKALFAQLGSAKTEEEGERIYKLYITALNTHMDKVFEYGVAAGKLSENNRYLQECDALIEAAGGERALEVLATK